MLKLRQIYIEFKMKENQSFWFHEMESDLFDYFG